MSFLVGLCECKGLLMVEACVTAGSIYRFHCKRCGFCSSYARRKFTDEDPDFHE